MEHRSERRLGGVLGGHAEFVWNWSSRGHPHLVMPCDAADLLFVEETGALMLAGANWSPRRASTQPLRLLGVRLRVGSKLFGSELDAHGRALARAMKGKTGADAESTLLKWLEQRASEVSTPDASLENAVTALWSGATVDDAVDQSGLSARTLERRFLRATGATPKRLQRLVRLSHAMTHRHHGNWAALAGYADQAHLIRDCREFLGVTPTELHH